MTPRGKFWLKVLLTATFPVWVIPAAVGFMFYGCAVMVWSDVSDMVDGRTSSVRGGGR